MKPNIMSGDITIFIKNKKIKRFDIVSIQPPTKDSINPFLKRVIGFEGETIKIIKGNLYINNKIVNQDFNLLKKDLLNVNPYTLKKGELYVLGDNRSNSLDSSELGAFHIKDIVGKLVIVIPNENIMTIIDYIFVSLLN